MLPLPLLAGPSFQRSNQHYNRHDRTRRHPYTHQPVAVRLFCQDSVEKHSILSLAVNKTAYIIVCPYVNTFLGRQFTFMPASVFQLSVVLFWTFVYFCLCYRFNVVLICFVTISWKKYSIPKTLFATYSEPDCLFLLSGLSNMLRGICTMMF